MKIQYFLCGLLSTCLLTSTLSAVETTYPPGFVGYDELQGQVYRGNVRHDGVFTTSGVPEAQGIQWSFASKAAIKSSPVCVNGIIYVGSDDMSFYAIDAESGTEKWSFTTDARILSSAAVVGDFVYFIAGTQVYALNAETGQLQWKNTAGVSLNFGSPVVAYGLVFCSAGGNRETHNETSWGGKLMKGFDVLTGELVWQQGQGRGAQGLSAPTLIEGNIIWTDGYNCNMANLATGDHVWSGYRGPWSSAQIQTPAVSGNYVLHTGVYGADHWGLPLNGHLVINHLATGKKYWDIHPYEGTDENKYEKTQDGKDHSIATAPTVFGDFVITADRSGDVHCLNYKEKKRVWKFQTDAGVESSPSYAQSIVYFGCNDGHVYALNATDGTLIWKIKTGEHCISSPWVADGALYIGNEDGHLYAIH